LVLDLYLSAAGTKEASPATITWIPNSNRSSRAPCVNAVASATVSGKRSAGSEAKYPRSPVANSSMSFAVHPDAPWTVSSTGSGGRIGRPDRAAGSMLIRPLRRG
jgi:hypothetical protein